MAEYDEDVSEGNAQIVRMQKYREKYKNTGYTLRQLVGFMAETQVERDALKSKLAECNAELDILRFEKIPEKMDEEETETIRYEGIGRVSLTADTRVALPKGLKPEFFKWCRAHKLGDLISETVNSSTLTSWVKGRIKAGKEVPSVLKVTPFTRASITKE